jgi:hypothetical protein
VSSSKSACTRWVFASLLTAVALGAPRADAADRRFAVVVGYNGSDDATLAPLAYADDDALRYGELLETSPSASRP